MFRGRRGKVPAHLLILGEYIPVQLRKAYFDTSIYACDPSGLPVYDNDAKSRTRIPEYAPYDIVFKEVRANHFWDVYPPYELGLLAVEPDAMDVHDMAPEDGHSIEEY